MQHPSFTLCQTKFKVGIYNHSTINNALISSNGIVYELADKQQHILMSLHIIKELSVINAIGKCNSHQTIEEQYIAANKNRGYDPAEFLLMTNGFVALSDGYLKYKDKLSIAQLRILNVYELSKRYNELTSTYIYEYASAKDYTLPTLTEEDKVYLNNASKYFKTTESCFHCPSGIPRKAYTTYLHTLNDATAIEDLHNAIKNCKIVQYKDIEQLIMNR